ncbi:MAG: hypothetical protein LBV21_06530 [Candidatus Adiutrix sp.]|jgi:hypothetical protein|nr:hypothetical protein [Candidatus Adiutrix sp.]
MKLFDLSSQERLVLRGLVRWHLGYMFLILIFFSIIYYFGYFKSSPWLQESNIFSYLAPLVTLGFVLVSPWRGHWRRAWADTRERLEGEKIFCGMAALVFGLGFYFYSLLLWGLGALLPSLFYM